MTSVPDRCSCFVNSLCFRRRCTGAPFISVLPPILISKIKVSATLPGSFAKKVSRSARLPVMTCLGALPSPWLMQGNLWHLDADEEEKEEEEEKESGKKTRHTYCSLMMLLCAWRLRPKYLSHNSYLMLERQHYCSAGGSERLSGPQRAVSSSPRQLIVGYTMSWSCIPHWYSFVCWKLAANSFHTLTVQEELK